MGKIQKDYRITKKIGDTKTTANCIYHDFGYAKDYFIKEVKKYIGDDEFQKFIISGIKDFNKEFTITSGDYEFTLTEKIWT